MPANFLPTPISDCQVIGLDLGGTKCAISHLVGDRVIEVLRIPTGDYSHTGSALMTGIRQLLDGRPLLFGVSCGGPLDSERGIILSPPNLHESWHGVPICRVLTEAFGGRWLLQSDRERTEADRLGAG